MQIQENFSLKPFNTFGIDVKARFFTAFSNEEELSELLIQNSQFTTLILGGGSNILFTKDFDGLVLKNEIKGIDLLHEDEAYYYVKAGAGENWHRFVMYCIGRGWAGIENLSLIPGSVGAAPMQNIGAYGVELSDVFLDLEAFHVQDKKIVTFTAADCEFSYRESVFKNKYRHRFVILNITLRLRKHPVFHTSYGTITQELEKIGVKELSIKAISQAVINIRSSKLPDPGTIGNAGSFFKNPMVPAKKFEELKTIFPGITGFKNSDGSVKLAAGWLIEHCGPAEGISWKGYRRGDAGVHASQALVLVNYGHASGDEIFRLSEAIYQSVKNKYGVELEREVNII
jgi:UDP-N-acetylmuramate dehydrogenase